MAGGKDMTLRQLEYFVEIVKQNSFTKAAKCKGFYVNEGWPNFL